MLNISELRCHYKWAYYSLPWAPVYKTRIKKFFSLLQLPVPNVSKWSGWQKHWSHVSKCGMQLIFFLLERRYDGNRPFTYDENRFGSLISINLNTFYLIIWFYIRIREAYRQHDCHYAYLNEYSWKIIEKIIIIL